MFRNLNNYIMLAIIFFALYLTGYLAYAQSYVEKQNAAHINLLENAGFESNLTKWGLVSGAVVGFLGTTSSTVSLIDWRYSFHMSNSSSGEVKICSSFYDPKSLKNSNGELGFKYRHSTINNASGTVIVENASGTVLSSEVLSATALGEIREVSRLFTFTDNNARVCLLGKGTGIPYGTNLDSVWLGSPRNVTQGPIVTNWETYTPAITGFGTVTNSNLQWRRVGDTLKIRGSWTGSTNSAQARIPLPTNMIATSSTTTAKIVGGVRRDGGTSTYLRRYNALLLSNDTNAIALGIEDDQSADPTVPTQGASANFKILGELTIPIQGLSGTATAFGRNCKDVYECENNFTMDVTSLGVGSNLNIPNWGTITRISTGTYEVTYNTIKLTNYMECSATSNSASNEVDTRIVPASSNNTKTRYMLVNSNLVDLDHILTCKRRGSDWVSKTAVQGYLSETVRSDIVNTKIAKGLVAGATETTVCSSSPCTLYRATKNVTSVTRSSTGQYVLNFSDFIRNPTCTFVVQNNTTSDVTVRLS